MIGAHQVKMRSLYLMDQVITSPPTRQSKVCMELISEMIYFASIPSIQVMKRIYQHILRCNEVIRRRRQSSVMMFSMLLLSIGSIVVSAK